MLFRARLDGAVNFLEIVAHRKFAQSTPMELVHRGKLSALKLAPIQHAPSLRDRLDCSAGLTPELLHPPAVRARLIFV